MAALWKGHAPRRPLRLTAVPSSKIKAITGFTINGHHVLIHEPQAGHNEIDQPQSQKERYIAIVAFNETGGLTAGARSGNGSAADLHKARIAVAEIANRLKEEGRADLVATGDGISSGLWKGLAQHNEVSVNSWNDCVSAARGALDGSNITDGATHFRLDRKDGAVPGWAGRIAPILTFEPFRNSGGGDAGPRPRIYVYP